MKTAGAGVSMFLLSTFVSIGCAPGTADAARQEPPRVNADQMLADVAFLAADSLEGRLSGSRGNRVAREYIVERFSRLGLRAFGDSFAQSFVVDRGGADLEGANVVGYIEGSTTASWSIVITAHFDHLGVRGREIYNGADDNASGTAALLAMAEYFTEHSPRHTLVFAAVDAEEGGLQGSRALVEHSPLDLAHVALNVNLDMISHNERELYVAGTHHYRFLRDYVEVVKARTEIDLLIGHDRPELGNDDWTGSSDHAPFHRRQKTVSLCSVTCPSSTLRSRDTKPQSETVHRSA
ncbi:MAG: M20/M25/M40 family metallo-hydrolase, partial [Gemmatimonadales bacterium]